MRVFLTLFRARGEGESYSTEGQPESLTEQGQLPVSVQHANVLSLGVA